MHATCSKNPELWENMRGWGARNRCLVGGIYSHACTGAGVGGLWNPARPHGLPCQRRQAAVWTSGGGMPFARLPAGLWAPVWSRQLLQSQSGFLPWAVPTPPFSQKEDSEAAEACLRDSSKHGGGWTWPGIAPSVQQETLNGFFLRFCLSSSSSMIMTCITAFSKENLWRGHSPERCKDQTPKGLKPSAFSVFGKRLVVLRKIRTKFALDSQPGISPLSGSEFPRW